MQRPSVLVERNVSFHNSLLTEIVSAAGCDAVLSTPGLSLHQGIETLEAPPALIIVPLFPEPEGVLTSIAAMRAIPHFARIPALGIGPLNDEALNLWQLRALGLVGLIDRRAIPEHVRFRVGQIVYSGHEGRAYERVPCCLPVQIEIDGDTLEAYAVTLSVGGMGIASLQRIEPNTNMTLRFEPDGRSRGIEVEARSVHARRVRRKGAEYEIGVFFREPSALSRRLIARAVADIKAAWEEVYWVDPDVG